MLHLLRRTAPLAVAALLLAGCATGTASATSTTATTVDLSALAGPAVPQPSPTPTAVTATPGQVLTADQAAHLDPGTTGFAMNDGSLVAVVKGQPVPATVIADIQARALARWPHRLVTVSAKDQPLVAMQQLKDWETFIHSTGHDLGGFLVLGVYPNCARFASDAGSGVHDRSVWIGTSDPAHTHARGEQAAVALNQDLAGKTNDAVVIPFEFSC